MKSLVVVLLLLSGAPAFARLPALTWTPAPGHEDELAEARRLRKVGIATLSVGSVLAVASVIAGTVLLLEGVSSITCDLGNGLSGFSGQRPQACPTVSPGLDNAAIGMAVPAGALLVSGITVAVVGARHMKHFMLPTVQPLGAHGHADGATVSLGARF